MTTMMMVIIIIINNNLLLPLFITILPGIITILLSLNYPPAPDNNSCVSLELLGLAMR